MRYIQPIGAAVNAPYVNENPGTGTEGSPVDARAIEHPLRELVAAIVAGGLTPDEGDLSQLAVAIANIAENAIDLADVVYLSVAQTFMKAKGFQYVALVEASPIAVDLSLSCAYSLNLTTSRTLGDPTGIVGARCGIIEVRQPVGGNCGLSTHANWLTENDEPISLTLTPNAVDILVYLTLSNGKVFLTKRENAL